MRRIQPAAVRAWIRDMDAEGLSPSRIRQARQVLRASLEQALMDGLIAKNPVTGVKVPPERHREMLFLTPEQVALLSEHAEARQHSAGALITFLAWTGLRWGEAVALRRSSLDLGGNRITVSKSATEVGGKLVVGPTKTHRARTIIVPESISRILNHHLQLGHPDELVFTAPRGGHLRASNFRRTVWVPATAALSQEHSVLAGLRIHDLRHTAASLAISAGGNVKAIQHMLGHKTASITLDRYGHLYEDDLADLANRLDERFQRLA